MSAINGTIIYRELGDPPDVLINWLDERSQLFNVLDDHDKEHLYIDNDVPRDADITPLLVQHTIGFSLFSEDGQRLSDYSRLDKAIRAQAGAKLVITPEVELESEIDIPDVEDPPMSALEASLLEQIESLKAQIASQAEDEPAKDESDESDESTD
jgi:hypothetical protein